MTKEEKFDVQHVKLEKRNLIEASAGTGKTFSIGILVIRLLIEDRPDFSEPLTIPEILMVTYTKNAVAELESRIRKFVRDAYKFSMNETDAIEEPIKETIRRVMGSDPEQHKKIQGRLKNAILQLDETNIQTIHSFCQRVLTEQAFETGQLFDARALTGEDFEIVQERVIRSWWRNNAQIMSYPLFQELHNYGFKYDVYSEHIRHAMNGKQMITSQTYTDEFSAEGQRLFLEQLNNQFNDPIDQLMDQLLIHLDAQKSIFREKYLKGRKIIGLSENDFNDTAVLLDNVISLWSRDTIQKVFEPLKNEIEQINNLADRKEKEIAAYIEKIFLFAIASVKKEIETYKHKYGVIFYDDMITRLMDAVKQKPQLANILQEKYRAVFVDEFQDTDAKQYDIFSGLFGQKTILFYIGDPKQSIYGFRAADIHTYFKARELGVDRQLFMNRNFRSSKSIIRCLNKFFKPNIEFDTFSTYTETNPQKRIDYKEVDTPSDKPEHGLFISEQPAPSLTLSEVNKSDEAAAAAAAQIVAFLEKDYLILDKGITRSVVLSDITVLVRWNREADYIKKALRKYNIPSVSVDDNKVLNSNEALSLLYVLEAAMDNKISSIHRALLISQTDITTEKLLHFDEYDLLERFSSYKTTWISHDGGVYVMLMKFMADFNIRNYLLQGDTEAGDRMLANLIQLIEILHSIEYQRSYSPLELTHWLKRAIKGEVQQGDEYEQRIESDEDSVKIVSIHKSKGLEYNIVVAPYLDMASLPSYKTRKLVHFRNDNDGLYYFGYNTSLNPTDKIWYETQHEQENKRLFYVALTRAKYACHIVHAKVDETSTLGNFIAASRKYITKTTEKSFDEIPVYDPGKFTYKKQNTVIGSDFRVASNFKLLRPEWRKLSYSALNPDHEYIPVLTHKTPEDPYDQFIFSRLKKGAGMGTRIHELMEHIDFSDPDSWNKHIDRLTDAVSSLKDEDKIHLQTMLQHLVHCNLNDGTQTFNLSQVPLSRRINELEFDYSISTFSLETFQGHAPDSTPWKCKKTDDPDGIMNGIIDLFFEHNGKYYILDWKSNYLGNSVDSYNAECVAEAMTSNNYHLQYHIYTIAAYKFLSKRLDSFNYETDFGGVFYLFLRGVRSSSNHGIYFNKPDAMLIQELIQLV